MEAMISGTLQKANSAWSGVRRASQNVPLRSRPRTGGNGRASGAVVVVVVTGSIPGPRASEGPHHSRAPRIPKGQCTPPPRPGVQGRAGSLPVDPSFLAVTAAGPPGELAGGAVGRDDGLVI